MNDDSQHARLREATSLLRTSCIRAEKTLHLAQEVTPRDIYARAISAWQPYLDEVPTVDRDGLDWCRARILAASAQERVDRDAVTAATQAAVTDIDAIAATAKASWPR